MLEDPKPGENPDVKALNKKAFEVICGPLLADQLGSRQFMFGDKFTAIDVFVGHSLLSIKRKRPGMSKNYSIKYLSSHKI